MKSYMLVMVMLLLSESVSAQFAYQCEPLNKRPFLSEVPCPEGMTWRRVQTDPYYNGPDPSNPTPQSRSATSGKSGKRDLGDIAGRFANMSCGDQFTTYHRMMNAGDLNATVALKPLIKGGCDCLELMKMRARAIDSGSLNTSYALKPFIKASCH